MLASMVAHMVTGAQVTLTIKLRRMTMMMQAKPLCQPAIDSNCLRKMMDQKSAWATNYSKWEADYKVSIIKSILIFLRRYPD